MATPKALTPAQKAAAAKASAEKIAKAKAAKFVELAEKRVTKAINAIRSISKLSNRSNYIYSDEQSGKIAEALRSEVVDMHEHFSATTGPEKAGFKL